MLDTIDSHSWSAGDRYVAFLQELRGLMSGALLEDPFDMRQREIFQRSAIQAGRRYIQAELAYIEYSLQEVVDKSSQKLTQDVLQDSATVKPSDRSLRYMEELESFLIAEITTQIQRDIATLQKRLEDFSLEAYMMLERNGYSKEEAHTRSIIDAKESLKFFFRDRSGKRYMSQKFIRTVTRHILLHAGTRIYMIEAALMGAKGVIMLHPDKKKSVHNEMLGFTRDQNLPLFDDVSEEVFHPNSRVKIKAVF